jgi:hypothetical protein
VSIYRAREDIETGSFKKTKDRGTRRPPGNVPYVVDNLWEWVREKDYPEYPNRRQSKFASPTPEQALRSVGLLSDCLEEAGMSEEQLESDGLPDECLEHVCRIEFVGDPAVRQLAPENPDYKIEDAKHHPDCTRLRDLVIGALGKFSWSSRPMAEKHPAGRLFQPCLTADEVEYLFDTAGGLKSHKEEIRQEVKYWEHLEPIGPDSLASGEGEILFEFRSREGYWRRPVEDGS